MKRATAPKRRLTLPTLALLALTIYGCPVNPATGERQLILISESTEIQMGRQGAQQVEASIGLYPDPDLQDYVNGIGRDLAARSERPDLPWSFKVVDDPVVNAFALPGGFIYVTRGILAHFDSEAELASVLGHEIGHVTGRHSAEQLSRAQLAQVGMGVGALFVPEVAQYGDLLNASLGLLFLKFGRDDERQADDLGLRYMRSDGYDPDEMVDVFAMLERVSEEAGGSQLPSWLSTHPNPEERQERMRETIAQIPGPAEGTVARNRYLRQIDGIVYGPNPRNGYFRGSTFLHPDLRFQMEFPSGWKTQNLPQVVAAISPNQDAILQLSLAQAATAEAAAQEFLSQQGIQPGSTSRDPVSGLPAVWGSFRATTQSGEVAGLAVWIDYGDHVYQILGYAGSRDYGSYRSTFRATLGSFDRLTDPEALNVEPRRVEIVRLERDMTLAEFASRYPSTLPIGKLALLNGVEEGETLPSGRLVKRVVGGVMPEGKQ